MPTMLRRREKRSLNSPDCRTNYSRGMNGEKQWDTSEIIAWLESPEGSKWSRQKHKQVYLLMMTKGDNGMYDQVLWYALAGIPPRDSECPG
jgi:hypothetical protein